MLGCTPQSHRAQCIQRFPCTGCCNGWFPSFVGWIFGCNGPCTACRVCLPKCKKTKVLILFDLFSVNNTGFNLCLKNGLPQLTGIDHFTCFPHFLIGNVQFLEFFSPDVWQSRRLITCKTSPKEEKTDNTNLVGAKQGPFLIVFHSFHEQVRNP